MDGSKGYIRSHVTTEINYEGKQKCKRLSVGNCYVICKGVILDDITFQKSIKFQIVFQIEQNKMSQQRYNLLNQWSVNTFIQYNESKSIENIMVRFRKE